MAFSLVGLFFGLQNKNAPAAEAARRPPNVIFILTDNQGAWTLGCYGNREIRTPNIDRMAAEGIRFKRALSSNPVCSPTRATFLTGLIPSQHGVHSFLDSRFMMGPEAYNTLEEFTSLGEILRAAGYTCGLSGKWHLGANMTPSEGFTTWTTKPDGSTQEFYDQPVIENGQLRTETGYTTDLWTRKGIEFIRENKNRPFFLFLAYNGPYSLGPMMTREAQNRHASYYADKPLFSFPRDSMHPWQHKNKNFHNTDIARRRVAAECSGIDDGVGEIISALKTNGLEENTLVIYSSDQGWMGGQNGMWGMGDHFNPVGAHELMMQIPLIFRHPGGIPAGTTCEALVSNYDFLPSVLGYLGLSTHMPKSPESPGRDFSNALRGVPLKNWENTVFYEMETTRAIRSEKWKLVVRHPNGPHELYDMQSDPQERINQFGQLGTETLQQNLRQQMDTFFNRYADPQFDLLKGGRSKAHRLTPN